MVLYIFHTLSILSFLLKYLTSQTCRSWQGTVVLYLFYYCISSMTGSTILLNTDVVVFRIIHFIAPHYYFYI